MLKYGETVRIKAEAAYRRYRQPVRIMGRFFAFTPESGDVVLWGGEQWPWSAVEQHPRWHQFPPEAYLPQRIGDEPV